MGSKSQEQQLESVEDCLAKHLPPEELQEVTRILYGKEAKYVYPFLRNLVKDVKFSPPVCLLHTFLSRSISVCSCHCILPSVCCRHSCHYISFIRSVVSFLFS